MTTVLDDYQKILRTVERIKTERDKAEGARDQLLKELESVYGVKTLEGAKSLLATLEKKESRTFDAYIVEKQKFLAEYGDRLDGR